MPMLNNCCFLCPLKTGSLVIGTLSLIGDAMKVIFIPIILSEGKPAIEKFSQNTVLAGQDYDVIRSTLIVGFVFSFIALLIDSVFIYGVTRDRPNMMKPCIFMNFIAIAILFIAAVMVSIQGGFNTIPASAVILILTIFLNLYFTLVIFSYYQEVVER